MSSSLQQRFNDLLQGVGAAIGSTPLVHMRRLIRSAHFQLYAKLEFLNPSGSIKDRPALRMIKRALEQGRIGPDSVLIESSSGNLAISLAQICSYLSLRFICVVDPKTTQANIYLMKLYGAEVIQVAEPDPESGEFLIARIKKVRSLLKEIEKSIWLNQYENQHNAEAHEESTFPEMFDQLKHIDYLFCAVSSCGTLRGCADYIRKHRLSTKLIAVDALGSCISGDGKSERRIPGLGAGMIPALYPKGEAALELQIPDWDCVKGCYQLVKRESILAGGSAGACVAAIEKLRNRIEPGAVCVFIIPDRGERYLDSIYNEQWLSRQFGKHQQELMGSD